MKKLILISILIGLMSTGSSIMAQAPQDQKEDYLGLPGDNLNLYAVMKLFQESKTLEEFERNLNDPNTEINNLDLNSDNMIDYIRVIDNVDGDVHNIVLQVPISERENQDVAVFTVQRFPNGQVQIQLTGDEDLYGKNYIIEPIYDDSNVTQTPNPGYAGNERTFNGQTVIVTRTNPYEISAWPLVRFIFLPNYVVWHSSWRWGYYPSYWHPWHPFYWHYYYGYHYNDYNYYYGHYRRWDNHRYTHWNDTYYSNRRVYSPHVAERIHEGAYKVTYSHPEQRREGEATYSRVQHNQISSRPDNNSGNSRMRNSDSGRQRTQTGSSARDNSSRRNVNTQVSQPVNNTYQGTRSDRSGRSATRTNRAATQQSSSVNSNQQSGQTKPASVRSTSRRSARAAKSDNSVKKEQRTKKAEKKKDNGDSRR